MAVQTERKQRLSAEERKAAIVEAAVHLFAERGFRGTTTRELAAAVGVSEPVLYQHFSAKSDLYSAIIEVICTEQHADTDEELMALSAAENDVEFFQTLGPCEDVSIAGNTRANFETLINGHRTVLHLHFDQAPQYMAGSGSVQP